MQISVNNLTVKYNENTPFETIAVNDVSLSIDKGEFIGIIGHTGSGKSTFIQTFNSLIKPTSGTIFIDGKDINENKNSMYENRFNVGLVFQYPEHQLFETTVYKDVAFGPSNMKLSSEEIYDRVKGALAIVGLDETYFEKSPFDLSGGQKRRVAIAGVLAMRPNILILDEPTAGLDPYSRDEILKNIKQMHDELNITVILVSHSMEDVAMLVDRIIVFNGGDVFIDNDVLSVFSKTDELQKIGLNSPDIYLLFKKLKEKGFNLPDNVFTIEDATTALLEILK